MIASSEIAAPLQIRLFGSVEARVRGNALPPLRSRKGYWLLALLALRAGREVERTWLLGALWPDSPESAARASLRTSLKDLRRALGPEAGRLSAPTPRTLCLELRDAEVDVLAFDTAISRGDSSALEQAVSLYRAPLLDGCPAEWAFPERQAREQACLGALEALAAGARAGGDSAAAERYLRQAVAVDPHRESAQRALMELLADQASYAAALQVYRDLRLRLHRDLNASPDPQTQALFEQLRAAAQRPAASGNLPAPATVLLGRERELTAIRDLLCGDVVRLLTLTGTGGTGKTRLALQAAAALGERFRDGAFFVSLAPLRDPKLVASRIAQTLGVREERGQSLRDRLKQHLREKQMLLLLDNFEQLVPAAPLVAELLAAVPGLKVMVTSRAALRLRGERLFPVSPLALPDRSRLPPLADLSLYAAVQLFIERALDVNPGFVVTNENAPAVAEICHRLDGLPLAIELAAARTRLLSPQALLSRLESRLKLLVGGPRDLPERQQTLRETIAWSYDLLNEPERRLFRRLAVFAGGCTLEAAEAICGAEGLEGLASLVDQSLLQQQERAGGEPCFTMMETVREFARECLEESREAELMWRRHAGYFLQLAEQAEPELRGAEAPAWMARLQAEIDNFRAALAGAVERGSGCAADEGGRSEGPDPGETGLRLAGALALFWRMQGQGSEGSQWLAQLLALPGAAAQTPLRAKGLAGMGLVAQGLQDYPAARVFYEQSLVVARECGDRVRIAWGCAALGDIARGQGRLGAARSYYEESLTLYRELADRSGLAGLVWSMGLMEVEAREWEHARVRLEESRAMYRELGDAWGVAAVTIGLSTEAALREKNPVKARRYAEECVEIYRRLGARARLAISLYQLAYTVMGQQNGEEARAFLEESLEIARELGDTWCMALALTGQGELAFRQGNLPLARARYSESGAVWRAQGFDGGGGLADALLSVGHIACRQDDYPGAQAAYVDALAGHWELFRQLEPNAVNRRLNLEMKIARSLEGLGFTAAEGGRPERAARLLAAAQVLRDGAEGRLSLHECGGPMASVESAARGRTLAVLRAVLGQAAFVAAWAEGQSMPLAQAIGYARATEGSAAFAQDSHSVT
jgi:predicted ATPase/DNA-binding SARP family transcriptional activator